MDKAVKVRRAKTGPKIRPPEKGTRRVSLGLQVSAATKQALNQIAQRDGVSLSRAAEELVDQALSTPSDDDLFRALTGLTKAELANKQIEAQLRAAGWESTITTIDRRPIRVWHPATGRRPVSGFPPEDVS